MCISFHCRGFSSLKQNNKCNARDQASGVVLRKLLCVKNLHGHVIGNHSRDLRASSCARVCQLNQAEPRRVKAQCIATFLLTNLRSHPTAAKKQTFTKWTANTYRPTVTTPWGVLKLEDLLILSNQCWLRTWNCWEDLLVWQL